MVGQCPIGQSCLISRAFFLRIHPHGLPFPCLRKISSISPHRYGSPFLSVTTPDGQFRHTSRRSLNCSSVVLRDLFTVVLTMDSAAPTTFLIPFLLMSIPHPPMKMWNCSLIEVHYFPMMNKITTFRRNNAL